MPSRPTRTIGPIVVGRLIQTKNGHHDHGFPILLPSSPTASIIKAPRMSQHRWSAAGLAQLGMSRVGICRDHKKQRSGGPVQDWTGSRERTGCPAEVEDVEGTDIGSGVDPRQRRRPSRRSR